MAYDAAVGNTLLFGGATFEPPTIYLSLGDTWTWDGANWAQASPSTSPWARYYHAMAYYPALSQVLLFGGEGMCPGGECPDTWTSVAAAAPAVLTAGSTSAAPGSAFSIPIALALATGVSVDALTFALQITQVGAAPVLAGSLGFAANGSITNAPVVGADRTSNTVSVLWSSLIPAFSGAAAIGAVTGALPAGAASGQSYTVTLTGASASLGGNLVAVTRGTNATLGVTVPYLVGDSAPYTTDTAPNFGDSLLNIQDLMDEMFSVNGVPGFVSAACSDRYDAMDVYPADSATTRGGDGVLDIRDLILEFVPCERLGHGAACTGVSRRCVRGGRKRRERGGAKPPGRCAEATGRRRWRAGSGRSRIDRRRRRTHPRIPGGPARSG